MSRVPREETRGTEESDEKGKVGYKVERGDGFDSIPEGETRYCYGT